MDLCATKNELLSLMVATRKDWSMVSSDATAEFWMASLNAQVDKVIQAMKNANIPFLLNGIATLLT
jgi:predicted trehalose synthase